MKKRLALIVLAIFFVIPMTASVALAAEGEQAPLPPEVKVYLAIAAGFGMALATIGGAFAQGKAAAAALEGIARNPGASGQMLIPLILGLALIETLVIYSLLIEILLVLKI